MTRRALAKPFVVGPPRAVSIKTRVFPTPEDEAVLREVGEHLGALMRSDVAARCRLGVGSKHLGRAERKRALTPRCSSRWAGAITRTADDMWEREFNNLEDMVKRDRREVSELDRRLALPVGEGKGKKRGYATRSERFQKARRRQKAGCEVGRYREAGRRWPRVHYRGGQGSGSQASQLGGRRSHPGGMAPAVGR